MDKEYPISFIKIFFKVYSKLLWLKQFRMCYYKKITIVELLTVFPLHHPIPFINLLELHIHIQVFYSFPILFNLKDLAGMCLPTAAKPLHAHRILTESQSHIFSITPLNSVTPLPRTVVCHQFPQ